MFNNARPQCRDSYTMCLSATLQTSVRDKLEPVVFSLNISLHEQKPKSRRSLQNLDSFPILSHDQEVSQRTEVNTGTDS